MQIAIDEQDDREPDPDLGRGDREDEQCEHLADVAVVERAERDQVDVHSREHQLDAHEHEHRMLAHEHAVHPGAEQEGGEDQEFVEQHP